VKLNTPKIVKKSVQSYGNRSLLAFQKIGPCLSHVVCYWLAIPFTTVAVKWRIIMNQIDWNTTAAYHQTWVKWPDKTVTDIRVAKNSKQRCPFKSVCSKFT